MHTEAEDQMYEFASIVRGDGITLPLGLDIGGRNVNGCVRDAFPVDKWEVLDLVPAPGVTKVGDFVTYTDKEMMDWLHDNGETFDLVLSTETLEHIHRQDHEEFIARALHLLRPGGWLVMSFATIGRAPHSYTGGKVGHEPYANVELSTWADFVHGSSVLWSIIKVANVPSDMYVLLKKR